MTSAKEDWQSHGWGDHDSFALEVGQRMSFRAKLQWLEDAHTFAKRFNRYRRWIDKDGVVHDPAGTPYTAEPPGSSPTA